MLKLVNTNNYFGQHEFHITECDMDFCISQIESAKWFKKPKITTSENLITVFCFTNYDKATIERLFGNG